MCMYAWINIKDWGTCTPTKIRCSETASEAILEQKQSRNSYMACKVLHPVISCPYMHLLSQLTLNCHERKYYSWQKSRWVFCFVWDNNSHLLVNWYWYENCSLCSALHSTEPCSFQSSLTWKMTTVNIFCLLVYLENGIDQHWSIVSLQY